jgi:adenylate cyclase
MSALGKLKRLWILVILNLIVVAFFLAHVTGSVHWRFIDRMENLAYDARMLVGMEKSPDPRIVIVDIDEKSLAVEGRWPWSRDKLARLLDRLFDHYRVRLVGFDVVFAEPDTSSGLNILDNLADNELNEVSEFRERLDAIRQQLDYDTIFARSIQRRPVVLGYYFNAAAEGGSTTRSGELPAPVFTEDDLRGRRIPAPRAAGYGGNLPELQRHAVGGGHFNPTIDDDGIVRRVPMLYEYSGQYYEALSLAMARLLLEAGTVEPLFGRDPAGNYTELEWLRAGHYLIPVDEKSQVLVPYRGRQGSFRYISATDVLNGAADQSLLNNAVILVGTSAPGLFDLRSTPVQSKYPGVEIQANLIAGILDQDIKQMPAYILGVEFVNLLALGLLIAFLMPLLTPLWAIVATVAFTAVSVSLNYYIWERANIVLPVASVIIMILAMFLLNMSYGFLIEKRRKDQITNLFGQYVPPELVDEMSNDPRAYSHEAEDREMTVLFSDVRGFTTLSEGLSPRELSQLMNEYLTSLTSIIHQKRGTIDKYMGDAIMAFWGAPVHDPDHARHALEAGLAMIEKMYALQDDFEKRGWPKLRIGVGINTGEMSVGNMGSKFRTAYTVIGDAVNLASRLEGLTKQYEVDLLVGEDTRNALPDYVFRELDRVRVKGKKEPVAVYEPLAKKDEAGADELNEIALFTQVLEHYRSREWDQAETLLLELKSRYQDRTIYKIYLERLQFFRKNPPGEDWDGVFTFTVK